jgi:hypothetical protein
MTRKPIRETPTFLPDSPLVTFDAIRSQFPRLVAGGHTEPAAFAAGILDYARREIPFESIGSPIEPRFHVWGAAAIALAALALPQKRKPTFPLSGPSPMYVRDLLIKMGGFGAVSADVTADSVWLAIQRIVSLQPSLQGDSVARFFQMLFLLELVDDQATFLSQTSPYDGLFQEALGCRVLDYVGLLFGLYAQSRVDCVFNLDILFEQSRDAVALRALAERIFAAEGCHQEKVGDLLDTEFSKHQAEGLVQAFFVKYPFVRLNDTYYLPPLHPFMRLLAASGPVFRALELARKAAKSSGQSSSWTNLHSSRMGIRFEHLVRSLVERAYAPGAWAAEYEYTKGQKSPDFILFEDDATVVLVQAKLKRMTPGAFFGYDLDTFREDSERFAEMIWRSVRYLQNIRKGKRSGKSDEDSVTERVLSAKRVVLVGIAPFLSPVFVPGLPRDTIVAAANKKLGPDVAHALVDIAAWHITGFDDLALFFSLPAGPTLGHAIVEYVHTMGDTFITDDGMVSSFRNWCIHKHSTTIKPPAAWRRAFELLTEYGTKVLFSP